jgi:hypothetical protein
LNVHLWIDTFTPDAVLGDPGMGDNRRDYEEEVAIKIGGAEAEYRTRFTSLEPSA